MEDLTTLLAAGAVVFCSFTLEGITGFGSSVIALPFVSMLLGLKMSVPYLCTLSVLLSLYIAFRSWRSVVWKEYFFIALHVAAGLPVGIFLFNRLSAPALSLLLACVMIAVGAGGGIRTLRKETAPPVPAGRGRGVLMRLLLVLGGIVHGAFGTGGPVVIIYASRALPEKGLFRMTLTMLWLTMNFIRIAEWTFQGTVWTAGMGKSFLVALPFVLAGMFLGDFLHRKADERIFRLCVYCVLFLAGIVMFSVNALKILC
ncbi:MAG: sulfite exporter TauE/SafE family protein [Lentisphaeria bacterium]|nr:sulfite exporter TauE/SafE family protein [Lentisphaeria bacterium]